MRKTTRSDSVPMAVDPVCRWRVFSHAQRTAEPFYDGVRSQVRRLSRTVRRTSAWSANLQRSASEEGDFIPRVLD
jgi:hypothetical protein